MQQVFTSIYDRCVWGNNGNSQYKGSSGPGSAIEYNRPYINFLRNFIYDLNIKSIADIGCGDFKCGELVYHPAEVRYKGYDVYEKLINHLNVIHPEFEFICLDVTTTPELIQPADLCVIKDVFQHWPNTSIDNFLDYVINYKLFKYILITNDITGQDGQDTTPGGYHRIIHTYPTFVKYGAKVVFMYYYRECCLIYCPPKI